MERQVHLMHIFIIDNIKKYMHNTIRKKKYLISKGGKMEQSAATIGKRIRVIDTNSLKHGEEGVIVAIQDKRWFPYYNSITVRLDSAPKSAFRYSRVQLEEV